MNTRSTRYTRAALAALLVIASLLWCHPTTSWAVEFAEPVSYPVGASPAAVMVADFNGDGQPDIAVANSGSGSVSILISSGGGTYKPAVSFGVGIPNPTCVATGDFNNDGIQDLAVWVAPGALSILLGNGDGTFQAPRVTQLPTALDLVVADFNLDHKPDLAVLDHDDSAGTSRLLFLAGNGDGTFQSPHQVSDVLSTIVVPANQAKYLVTADLNHDAKPDLAVEVSGGIQLFTGRGDGTFQAGPMLSLAGGLVSEDLQVANINADDNPDLLTFCSVKHSDGTVEVRISLFLGRGDGQFQAEQIVADGTLVHVQKFPFDFTLSPVGFPVAGNFNGDGKPDLAYEIVGNPRVRLGQGEGVFATALSVPDPGSIGKDFFAADLNNDNLSDLIFLDPSNNVIRIELNISPTSGSDLGIIGATAGPPADGSSFSYAAEIMNEGPQNATGVTSTAVLPHGVTFVSATATQGSCTQSSGTVICAIGSLASGLDATVTIAVTLKPTAAEQTLSANMKVAANEPDLSLANNTAEPSVAVFMLAVSTDGTGTGTVTSSPAGISCGATCSQGYLANSTVTLTATPTPGSVFTGWDGDTSGGVDNVAMSASRTVRATFSATPPPAGGSSPRGGGGGGSVGLVDLFWMLCLGVERTLSLGSRKRYNDLSRLIFPRFQHSRTKAAQLQRRVSCHISNSV